MKTAVTYIDGGCRPTNPGHAAFAVVIDLDGEEFILSRYIGHATNNVAEYTGLIVAVKYARHLGAEALEVFSDSKLVVEQTHGRWRIKARELVPLCREARDLLFRHFLLPGVLRGQPARTMSRLITTVAEPSTPGGTAIPSYPNASSRNVRARSSIRLLASEAGQASPLLGPVIAAIAVPTLHKQYQLPRQAVKEK